MTSSQRLQEIARFVQKHLIEKAAEHPSEQHNPVYRWEHTLRVASYGKLLAKAEEADVEAVVAACLLHDIAHFECDEDYKGHGRVGAQIARQFLSTLDYASHRIDNICYAIAVHVDGEAGFDHPETIEASCVTDADNIDRFGAYRILQWCIPEMNDFPKLIDKISQRIEILRDYRQRDKLLETDGGDKFFKQQLDRQIAYFQALVDEFALTQLPEIETVAGER
jgi:uncharacterized protein